MRCIRYKAGYKYQLKEPYSLRIPIRPDKTVASPGDYVRLTPEGELTIREGYAWDGPSGPTVDTASFMRGSLVHDALYQLMRECKDDFPKETYRELADELLYELFREDGMWWLRANWVYYAVRLFGDPAADPASDHPLERAPKGCEP